MNLVWGKLMEQVAGVLKHEKISLAFLTTMLFLAGYAYTWANENFVQQDDFNALKTQVDEGFEDSELRDAGQAVQLLRIEKLLVNATSDSDAEKAAIEAQYESAKAYKDCLRRRGPNCEHLKDPD